MDETSLQEIPEWIILSLILEFAVLAEQICLAKTAFSESAAATFAGWIERRKFATANSANWIACTQRGQFRNTDDTKIALFQGEKVNLFDSI